MPHPSFSEKMSDWIRHILSCCDKAEDEEPKKVLQIVRPATSPSLWTTPLSRLNAADQLRFDVQQSGPTNFRREDITIPGLDPEQ